MASLASEISGLLYPSQCSFCDVFSGDLHFGVCEVCRTNLRLLDAPFFSLRFPRPYFDASYSACVFEREVISAVHRLKYSSSFEVLPYCSHILQNAFERFFQNVSLDCVIPVPVHSFRLWKRGYNQAALLAEKLAKTNAIPFERKGLKRKWVMGKSSQVGSSADDRLHQIKNNFYLSTKADVFGKNILLIDDVITTGATINECAKMLKKAKAEKVFVLTLARTL
ncbi:MAG: hypothetical protein COX62_07795 [Deltaproteobacteria bacterium CG_4_10_14_0_2_um_filter_43_8]|nr:MAG: hypothetical protein COV43_01240 [Deltaproteobacteria bacterium CG11_big_fil_rev_8_21_14_0_20_42_23]PJA18900.1 MAG: hypothetical protein COX62_07795 [Deltaproteobacteria bacterium CG_4_10_14_0_2_um_filter_43_8]PJC63527.1 MAG: hypothetical protein CO021_08755 [Deltaproteobacteria bacterium CG_4_9_14_0_2_um_filter_42_21]